MLFLVIVKLSALGFKKVFKTKNSWDWRHGPAVKSTCCICWRPGLIPSTYLAADIHLPLQFHEIQCPPWGLHTCSAQTYTHLNIHTYKYCKPHNKQSRWIYRLTEILQIYSFLKNRRMSKMHSQDLILAMRFMFNKKSFVWLARWLSR